MHNLVLYYGMIIAMVTIWVSLSCTMVQYPYGCEPVLPTQLPIYIYIYIYNYIYNDTVYACYFCL